MAKVGDYNISKIYQGGYSSLKPYQNISPSGQPISTGDIGMSTDARTANVVKEISKSLSAGGKTVELNQVFPEVFDSVPIEQLKEVRRLAILTGVDVTVHAPVIEPSGMTKEGFTEEGREMAERQMFQAIVKTHEVNPNGGAPITFHSSVMLPGQIKPQNGEVEETYVINTQTKGINKIPLKERRFPGEGEVTVEKEIARINEDTWSSQITNLGYSTERAGTLIRHAVGDAILAKGEKEVGKKLEFEQKQAIQEYNIGKNYLSDSYRQLKELYDIAYKNSNGEDKNSNGEDKKILEKMGQQITEKVNKINNHPKESERVSLMQEVIEEGLETFDKLSAPPKIYKELNSYAQDKTVETFANVAWKTYDKYKDKSPIICIENPPIPGAFSTGEELREIIEKTKKKFVEHAEKEGMSKSAAIKQADKLIGATWDVGHINMLKKYGYDDKYLIKQTEKIAPLVKHVHLSDNFGFEHTELPMGMGNVPIKEIMEKLGKEGYKGKKIVEALNWWQHFSEQGANPPFAPTLEAFGSPIYSDGVGPYWNQVIGLQQGYFGGQGMMLPNISYETFGAGFSQLPVELGGQRGGGAGGRMSGRPME